MRRKITDKGELNTVFNKERRFGSAQTYESAYLSKGNVTRGYAFTQAQLDEAAQRFDDNPEDAPKLRSSRWFSNWW